MPLKKHSSWFFVGLVLCLMFLFPERSCGQDYHERNLPVFRNSIGITDNHNGYLNLSFRDKAQIYCGTTLFTDRLRNQAFLVGVDFHLLNREILYLSAGLHYSGTFSSLPPTFGIPVSALLSTKSKKLYLMNEVELYYRGGKFSVLYNAEISGFFLQDYCWAAGYKTNPYMPLNENIFSISLGICEQDMFARANINIPEDFNLRQALLTLSIGVRLGKFAKIQ